MTGAVFMCAYTTKTAVYVLARAFPGYEVLAIMGTAMTIYGVVYATIENDMRRILSYHIISQVGYMVAGVGIGTELALNGACAHAYAHILYKALLFMGAGAVLEMTGRSKLNELGGLYKYMPLSLIFYVVGGISISGFPLFSGFVSKSLDRGRGRGGPSQCPDGPDASGLGGHLPVGGVEAALFRLVRQGLRPHPQGTAQEYALGHGADFPPLPDYRRLSPGAL